MLTDMYFSFLRDKVSCSRGWPLTCYVAEDELELLNPATSASQLLGYKLPCSFAGMYTGKSCESKWFLNLLESHTLLPIIKHFSKSFLKVNLL